MFHSGFRLLALSTLIAIGIACSPVTEESPENFRIIGYLPNYRFADFSPQRADPLTDLILFAAEPDQQGNLDLGKVADAPWEMLRKLQLERDLQVLLCVGGWGKSDRFSSIVKDFNSRNRFVDSVIETLKKHQLDGLDIDWEHPETKEDWEGFIKLLQQLRVAFRPEKLTLSLTVSPWRELPRRAWEAVDRVQLMSYDYGQQHSTLAQARSDIRMFLKQGIPSDNLILGMPCYGREIEDRAAITYSRIVERYHPEPDVDEVKGYFFNGPLTIQYKTQSALRAGLGGVMVWEIGQDTVDETSLLRTISKTVSEFNK